MTRVLVTGATGFVGRVLCEALAGSGHLVRAALRTDRSVPTSISEKVIVGDIHGSTDWAEALDGVDAVIHAAARTHVLNAPPASAHLYRETNERGTERLASEAARMKVSRFVFLSSVKVNGEETEVRAFRACDEPRPQDDYGLSKWHAEQHVLEIGGGSAMQAVIVRAPLVYGSGVRANFLRLLQWVDRGWPLPLGAVRNARSLVSVWNLCDLLLLALTHPRAPARIWLVSDGEDLSTPDLIRRIASAMGRRARLLSVPLALLCPSAALLGRGGEFKRLCGSLTVDISQTRAQLAWSPPMRLDEALARTVAWYRSRGQSDAA